MQEGISTFKNSMTSVKVEIAFLGSLLYLEAFFHPHGFSSPSATWRSTLNFSGLLDLGVPFGIKTFS